MKLFKKIIYPQNFKRVIPLLVFIIAITSITMGSVYDVALKDVTLVYTDEFNGVDESNDLTTRKTTVGEFLAENDIEVGENDIINKQPEEELVDNDVVVMRKGRVIELSADGRVEIVKTTKATVGEALVEIGIVLGDEDVVTPQKDEAVSDNMVVTVDRYLTEYTTEIQPIEFETKKVNDKTLESGKTKVKVEGSKGEKKIDYVLKLKNGEVISKEVVSEEVVKEPVTKVIRVGTKKVQKASSKKTQDTSSSKNSKGKDFSYSKKFTMTATAYNPSPAENGGHTKTAYGLTPQFGVVAVDPKVIPLGTKLYIESSDGGKSWVYGYCIAGDTGGAIKGNKVDLCFNTSKECVKFGRKSATVYVLN